jgi:GT2 family glycosyltransferase
VLVFLNNDVRVARDWMRKIVAPLVRGECHTTTGKMYSWDGRHIDHAGGGSNFQGIAISQGYKETDGPELGFPRKVLFACGGAMAFDAKAYHDVGGFDDEYFAYYEDLDLGWRTWLCGYEVHYLPDAVSYHEHSSTARRFPFEMIRVLQVRNSLFTCFKNYDDENLEKVLPVLLATAIRRAWVMARLGDVSRYRIDRPGARKRHLLRRLIDAVRTGYGRDRIGKLGLAALIGINDLLGNWKHWEARRAEVQARRRTPDAEIFELFLRPFWCVEGDPGYIELQDELLRRAGLEEVFAGLHYSVSEPWK